MPRISAKDEHLTSLRRILVVCPGNAVTGGPEALHQLVDAMRRAGHPAFIVYWPADRTFEVPPPYAQYDAPQAPYEDLPGELIILDLGPGLMLEEVIHHPLHGMECSVM